MVGCIRLSAHISSDESGSFLGFPALRGRSFAEADLFSLALQLTQSAPRLEAEAGQQKRLACKLAMKQGESQKLPTCMNHTFPSRVAVAQQRP